MIGKSQKNQRPATLAEVKDILNNRASQPEFGYEQQVCLDYANKFCKLSLEDAKKLESQLEQMEGMTAEAAAKITDILPTCKSTLQAILAKDKLELGSSTLDQILEHVLKARENMIEPPPPPKKEEDKPEGEEAEEKDASKSEEKAKEPTEQSQEEQGEK